MKKHKVLFICLGNICRSPAAEAVLRARVQAIGQDHLWEIDSAGIGRWHVGELPDRRMRIAARARGIELTHRCRQVTRRDFDRFDLIIGMDSQNIADLRDLAPSPEAMAKIHSIAEYFTHPHYDHIPDPYYEGAEGFELVLDLLEQAVQNIAP